MMKAGAAGKGARVVDTDNVPRPQFTSRSEETFNTMSLGEQLVPSTLSNVSIVDGGNASPAFMRITMNQVPASKDMYVDHRPRLTFPLIFLFFQAQSLQNSALCCSAAPQRRYGMQCWLDRVPHWRAHSLYRLQRLHQRFRKMARQRTRMDLQPLRPAKRRQQVRFFLKNLLLFSSNLTSMC
jgi:hypothetical protein